MTTYRYNVDTETRLAIQELVTEHSYLVDHGRAEELAGLYGPDGELLGLPPANLIGRNAIAGWGRDRVRMTNRTSRHIESNLRLEWAGDSLTGLMSVMMFRSDTDDLTNTTPSMVGNYHDEYVQIDDVWYFRRRRIVRAFAAPVLRAQPV
ncbi:hypothetical protein BH09ACT6_BH09ACT6_05120 [soil metagenome]